MTVIRNKVSTNCYDFHSFKATRNSGNSCWLEFLPHTQQVFNECLWLDIQTFKLKLHVTTKSNNHVEVLFSGFLKNSKRSLHTIIQKLQSYGLPASQNKQHHVLEKCIASSSTRNTFSLAKVLVKLPSVP